MESDMFRPARFLAFSVLALSLLPATSARAQFERYNADIFLYTGRNFEVQLMDGHPPTVSVFAIIDLPTALYVIFSNDRSYNTPLGTFQCNKEFTLLKTQSNGLYDVRCVNDTPYTKDDVSTLKFDGTRYQQIF